MMATSKLAGKKHCWLGYRLYSASTFVLHCVAVVFTSSKCLGVLQEVMNIHVLKSRIFISLLIIPHQSPMFHSSVPISLSAICLLCHRPDRGHNKMSAGICPFVAYLNIKARSDRALRRAWTRVNARLRAYTRVDTSNQTLMLKIGSIHTERIDARQLICTN